MPVTGVSHGASRADAVQLVVRNARIYTGDVQRPSASAVAITNGRIVRVGGDEEFAPLIVEGTRVIDALGRRIVPGLNDSHRHVIRDGRERVLRSRSSPGSDDQTVKIRAT